MLCIQCGIESTKGSNFCANCGHPAMENNTRDESRNGYPHDGFNYSLSFKRKFKKVFNEIDHIAVKIDQREGWLFTNHVYSKEELLNSPHHRKIYSITEKIGDDARNWDIKGRLPREAKEVYEEYRSDVEDGLHEISLKIESRKPTWWEDLKGVLEDYACHIMDNMPLLSGWLLTAGKSLSRLPGRYGVVGGFIVSATDKLLRSSKRSIRKIEFVN